MKKNYSLLCIVLMLSAMTNLAWAQSYSLKDLSAAEFATGGNTQWSFQKYDVATGQYTSFTTYNAYGAVNNFDAATPSRFGAYPIMETLLASYSRDRNSWYNEDSELLYVARDYEVGTTCYNLVYGSSIPTEYMGYEVHSSPTAIGSTFRNAAITFKVPADGYYRVDMSVIREDNPTTTPMTVIQRYRYNGKTQVPDGSRLNQGFTYGIGGIPEVVPPPKETTDDIYSTYIKYAAQPITSNHFFVYAKAGDMLSFEADARSVIDIGSTLRSIWARTKWTELKFTVVNEATAKADAAKFVDAYTVNPALKSKLDDLLEEITELIGDYKSEEYPQAALNDLEAAYAAVDNIYGSIKALEYEGYIDQLQTAIYIYKLYGKGLKVQYLFDNVLNGVVPDASGSGNTGKLLNQAKVEKMGNFNILNLGSPSGYLDMGSMIGRVVSAMSTFTISTYYWIDPSVNLTGPGWMLFAFSNKTDVWQYEGEAIWAPLTTTAFAITKAGWYQNNSVKTDKPSVKGEWVHLAAVQSEDSLRLYVNGAVVAKGTPMIPSNTFTAPTSYNWIGRPPFNGNNYMKNTLVYDFRVYNYAIESELIPELGDKKADLDYAKDYGTEVGDFTELKALISTYNNILGNIVIGNAIGQYPDDSGKQEFADAIAQAQALVNENKAGQSKIISEITVLNAAYDKLAATANCVMVHPASEGETATPFESGIYYIQVGNYFLTMPSNGGNNTFMVLSPYIENPDKIYNNQVWNIQYNHTYSDLVLNPENPKALYSFVSSPSAPWTGDGNWHMDEDGRMKSGNTEIAQNDTENNYSWRGHRIYFNGTAYSIVNDYYNRALAFPEEREGEIAKSRNEKRFNYRFRTVNDVVANPPVVSINDVFENEAIVFGGNNEIIILGELAGQPITVYNTFGRVMQTAKAGNGETRLNAATGFYIVKVGKQAVKVVVR